MAAEQYVLMVNISKYHKTMLNMPFVSSQKKYNSLSCQL